MREIKFRAWDKTKKEMVLNQNFLYHKDGYLLSGNSGSWNNSDYMFMQFTGLKDKNGKEIYEGDILQINDEEHEGNAKIVYVEYKRGGFVDSYFHRYIGNIKTYKIEIIGNKYENYKYKQSNKRDRTYNKRMHK